MRALLCHCGQRLEADDDQALLALVEDHVSREYPAILSTDEQVMEIVAARAHDFEYVAGGVRQRCGDGRRV
jgi:hypothetical protein